MSVIVPPHAPGPAGPPKGPSRIAMQFALAMELPFLLVACVVLGGLFGYWLDGRLGTSPGLLLLFGLLGFAAGVREVLRRLKAAERLRRNSPAKPPPE